MDNFWRLYALIFTCIFCLLTAAPSIASVKLLPSIISSAPAAGEPATYDGFKIEIAAGTEWIALQSILMYDCDDSEFFTALTSLTETQALTYAAVSAGEFATDSPYGADDSRKFLNDASPDISSPTSAPGNVEWSNGATSQIHVFIKPTTAKSIKSFYIASDTRTQYDYWINNGDLTLKDGDGNVITLTTVPTDRDDIYQTTSTVNSGWYEYLTGECS